MACVTLKRPLDHFSEPLLSPAAHHVSPPHHGPPSKRRRCVPVRRAPGAQEYDDPAESPGWPSGPGSSQSAFVESPLSTSQVASGLRDELKRLKRRKQLAPAASDSPASAPRTPPRPLTVPAGPRSPGSHSPEPMMDDASAVRAAAGILQGQASGPSTSAALPNLLAKSDNKPIFTLKQMTMICERMCKERTDQVREEYDKILNQKLSEQYESFVRFIDQQIQRRFSQAQAPSYLS